MAVDSPDYRSGVVLALLRREASEDELCRRHGISHGTLMEWRADFLAGNYNGPKAVEFFDHSKAANSPLVGVICLIIGVVGLIAVCSFISAGQIEWHSKSGHLHVISFEKDTVIFCLNLGITALVSTALLAFGSFMLYRALRQQDAQLAAATIADPRPAPALVTASSSLAARTPRPPTPPAATVAVHAHAPAGGFFAAEDRAKRQALLLAWLFAGAVLALILTANAAAAAAIACAPSWQPHAIAVHAWLTIATVAAIAGGSAWKIRELRGGGGVVAMAMGGRQVIAGTADPGQRMLMNVVEEMAIASGVPVPALYVIDDDAINAFAAGHGPRDAAVVVTRGAAERLSRDELQGVIAHEFSHLLNGDMAMNLRLVGVLYGILIIALSGQLLLRLVPRSRNIYLAGGLIALGLAMVVLGYVGYLLGGLIRAAICRRREYLADASALQFTRNSAGIGGALKKLGAGYLRSHVSQPHNEQFGHLFFANSEARPPLAMLATHPPLEDRIRAIDPHWDGQWPAVPTAHPIDPRYGAGNVSYAASSAVPDPDWANANGPGAGRIPTGIALAAALPIMSSFHPATFSAHAGRVTPAHVSWSAALLASIPPAIGTAAREPDGARAVVIALLLGGGDGVHTAAQRAQVAAADAGLAAQLRALEGPVRSLGEAARLPLLTLTIAALKQLGHDQRKDFITLILALAKLDGVTLRDYSLVRLVKDHLLPHAATPTTIYALHPLRDAVAVLLSDLAHEGSNDPAAIAAAFAAGCASLGGDDRLTLAARGSVHSGDLDHALKLIDQANAPLKRRIVAACAACLAADGTVTAREAELLRMVADYLGCPLPPFVDAPGWDPVAAT